MVFLAIFKDHGNIYLFPQMRELNEKANKHNKVFENFKPFIGNS